MFKPVPLVVSVLASSGSIFLSMPFVVAQRTCNGTQAVTTQNSDGFSLPCMQEVPGAQRYNCNANEVRVAGVEILELRDVNDNVIPTDANGQYACESGQELSVDFVATLLNGAKGSARYDSAVFWSNGTDALTGNDCAYSSFTAVGTSNNTEPPDGLPDLEDPGEFDNCGDLPGDGTDRADICDLKIICQGGENVTLASCIAYKDPGASNGICNNTDPRTFIPSNPAKCECELTDLGIKIRSPSPSSVPSAMRTEPPSESPSSVPSAMPSESPTSSPVVPTPTDPPVPTPTTKSSKGPKGGKSSKEPKGGKSSKEPKGKGGKSSKSCNGKGKGKGHVGHGARAKSDKAGKGRNLGDEDYDNCDNDESTYAATSSYAEEDYYSSGVIEGGNAQIGANAMGGATSSSSTVQVSTILKVTTSVFAVVMMVFYA